MRIFYKKTTDFRTKLATLSLAIDLYKNFMLYKQNFRCIQTPLRPQSVHEARFIHLIMFLYVKLVTEFLKLTKLITRKGNYERKKDKEKK